MENLTLAIETSVKTGSLALLNDRQVIGHWTGNDNVSRSEDLIPQISKLFETHDLIPRQLKRIAVSIGPGSFTGIRVGVAAAKALALALNCPLVGISIFEALSFENPFSVSDTGNTTGAEKIMVVVSAGRELYFWQTFQGAVGISEPSTGNLELLKDALERVGITKILAETHAGQSIEQSGDPQFSNYRIITRNYAELVGLTALHRPENQEQEDIYPLYIRQAVMSRL